MKKSEEETTFLTAFAALKSACGDEPRRVEWLARNNDTFKEVACELCHTGRSLRRYEDTRKEKYSANVGRDFRKAWRDFEERYEQVVLDAVLQLPETLVEEFGFTRPTEVRTPEEVDWDNCDDEAEISADGIFYAMSYAEDEASGRTGPDGRRSKEDWQIHDGNEAVEKLRTIGVDFRGILRRRALLPFVNLPDHLGNDLKPEEHEYQMLLLEAQQAFIFGSLVGTLIVLRSLLEKFLFDFYPTKVNSLEGHLDKAPLPEFNERLKKFKEFADDVIHNNPETDTDHGNTNGSKTANLLRRSARDREVLVLGYLKLFRDLLESELRQKRMK